MVFIIQEMFFCLFVHQCPTCQPEWTECTQPWQHWSRSSDCRSSGPNLGRPCCPPSAVLWWTEAGWPAGSGWILQSLGWARRSAPGPGRWRQPAGSAGWLWSGRKAEWSRRWSGCAPGSWCIPSPWYRFAKWATSECVFTFLGRGQTKYSAVHVYLKTCGQQSWLWLPISKPTLRMASIHKTWAVWRRTPWGRLICSRRCSTRCFTANKTNAKILLTLKL